MTRLILIIAILLATPAQSRSRPICDQRERLISHLTKAYREHQSGIGISKSGRQVVELFTSATGSWTILASRPDGISCAVAAGSSWENVKSAPSGAPS